MNNKKIIVIIVLVLLLISVMVLYKNANKEDANETEKYIPGQNIGKPGAIESEEPVEYLNDVNMENEYVLSMNDDETALEIQEKTKGTIKSTSVNKSGNSSNLSVSDREGWNSAIQVNRSSDITIYDVEVTTSGSGASGVVATGSNSVINISDSSISTSQQRSKGLLVSNGGTINATNMEITTAGLKSSAVATDYGIGLINIKNSTIKCSGEKSAGVYATSTIIAEDTSIESAEGAVIDGQGKVAFTNVDVTTFQKRAVMIYYTGPKVGDTIKGTFNMTKGSLNVKDGQAFYVMNTEGIINIEQVEMNIESGIFLKASVDAYGELGQEGGKVESKGGNATVNCINQTIEGDIIVDGQSTVELNLTQKSSYTGKINTENTGKEVTLKLARDSKVTLTGDSYITVLDNEDTNNSNIDFNGYKLYVNGNKIN